MILSPSLGAVFGYALTFYCIMVYDSWRLSFVIQGIIFVVFAITVMVLPSDYININVVNKLREEESIKRSSGIVSKKDNSGVTTTYPQTQYSSGSDADNTPLPHKNRKATSQINPRAKLLTTDQEFDNENHNYDNYFSSRESC